MTTRSPSAPDRRACVVALVGLGLLAGCVDGTAPATDTTADPTTAQAPETTTDGAVAEFDAFVFDLPTSKDPVVDGGLRGGDTSEETVYVTSVGAAAETERFNRSLLPSDAEAFVDAVRFEREFLVVVQASPASTVPDYRVESLERGGETLRVGINDASSGGTDDITVETVLIRVPGTVPERVVVTTETGASFTPTGG